MGGRKYTIMSYLVFKHLHMTLALVSVAFFTVRFISCQQGCKWQQQRWVRVLPHVIDSLLLALGIVLVWLSSQLPWQQGWLAEKLLLLLCYIGFGMVAMKTSKRQRQWQAFALALLAAGGIFYLARIKNPFFLPTML